MDSGFSKLAERFKKKKFTFLLGFLFLYAMAVPFFETFLHQRLFLSSTFSAVLVSAVLVVSEHRKSLLLLLAIATPCFLVVWLKHVVPYDEILVMEVIFRLIFNGFMIYVVAHYILRTDTVSRDTISAALIGYLLLALLWSNLYYLLELLIPGSFTLSHELIRSDPSSLRYFSFVTISTLGYGDISPITPQSRSLATMEALIGQIYLAVIIARLVGIYTAISFENKDKP